MYSEISNEHLSNCCGKHDYLSYFKSMQKKCNEAETVNQMFLYIKLFPKKTKTEKPFYSFKLFQFDIMGQLN